MIRTTLPQYIPVERDLSTGRGDLQIFITDCPIINKSTSLNCCIFKLCQGSVLFTHVSEVKRKVKAAGWTGPLCWPAVETRAAFLATARPSAPHTVSGSHRQQVPTRANIATHPDPVTLVNCSCPALSCSERGAALHSPRIPRYNNALRCLLHPLPVCVVDD